MNKKGTIFKGGHLLRANSLYPTGYKTLFWVKLLGNFSFYGMRSVLVLYLTLKYLVSDERAFGLYGTFMALAYLTPLLGGWLSDQVLGIKKSILMSGWLVFLGSLLLSIPYETLHFIGLALVSVGTGFFKPNSMSAVGALFPDPDSKTRDSAYTNFYVGMNIGSCLGPLFCGWLGQQYGWSLVFPVTGALALLGSLMFQQAFKTSVFFKNQSPHQTTSPALVYGSIALFSGGIFFVLRYADQLKWLIPSIILLGVGCLGLIALKTKGQERRNIGQIGILMLLFAVFSSLFEQTGSSITLFIERGVDRVLFQSMTLPTPFFQSINPALVVILGPLIASLWIQREKKKKPVSLLGKFALGFLFMGLTFLMLSLCITPSSPHLLSPLWILLVLSLQVIGEICIVPIGFSGVSKLAPPRFSALIMGLWMLSISCGHYVAAFLAKFSSIPKIEGDNLELSMATYQDFFLHISFIPFIVFTLIGAYLLFNKLYSHHKKG